MMRLQRVSRSSAVCGLLLSLVAASGCTLSRSGPLDHAEVPVLVGYTSTSVDPSLVPRPSSDIMQLTPEMRQFARDSVRHASNDEQRMKQLSTAVLHPGSLGVRYLDRVTRTAAEAFEKANGNCLSLSILFTALAREAGIDATFYEVNVLPDWTLAGDVVFSTRHINVSGKMSHGGSYVMDFSPYLIRREIGRRRVTEREAIAQYYNNLGAEYLADGEIVGAYLHFKKSVELAPKISFFWSNLAVVYSRSGQFGDAELALQQAIAIDASNTSAMNNLVRLYEKTDNTEASAALAVQLAKVQEKNPYYQFVLGEREIADENYREALTKFQTAIRLQPREPMFYLRAADAAAVLQETDLVNLYVARAEALKPQ